MIKKYYDPYLIELAEHIIRTTKDTFALKMAQAYYMVSKQNFTTKDTAKALNISTSTVSRYRKQFAEAVSKDFKIKKPKPCRHFAYTTLEEEKEFIESLRADAAKGLIGTQEDVRQRFIQRFGREIGIPGISKLLKRNGWRKLVPRSSNPKANRKEQEDYKKTCRNNHGKTKGEC